MYNSGKRSVTFKLNGNIKLQNEAFFGEYRGVAWKSKKKKRNKIKDRP
jgi:hypothetical protein